MRLRSRTFTEGSVFKMNRIPYFFNVKIISNFDAVDDEIVFKYFSFCHRVYRLGLQVMNFDRIISLAYWNGSFRTNSLVKSSKFVVICSKM